ncbi:TonB-dependent receptor [Candidatus Halobeggiatoa sp. HSG11]|nr:TonB-dependent receptor [Candidatus Halobeggiatoa sp. HSG11]
MNIKIESVSKKEESIFDAPLSSTIITQQEILNSGVTSIMEALRLAPGMIVREQSPGNFDVHLRGFDAVPPNSTFVTSSNTLTLVMIDGRPVYNYFAGGTFWETLPIGLSDVEKIEIVRGPSAALYGPNAATGVVNIITQKASKAGGSFTANIAEGEHHSRIITGSLGYRHKDVGIKLSANYQRKNRQETEYYELYRDIYVSNPSDLYTYTPRPMSNANEKFPEPNLSLEKYGVNTFINFTPSDDISFDLSLGIQDSRSQKVYIDNNATVFNTFDSETKYADLKAKIFGFSGQISYLTGQQEPLGIPRWPFDFSTLDILLEYDYQGSNFDLRPGVSWRKALYDAGFIGGEQELNAIAAFLRAEYRPSEQWRFIAAIRADKHNYPDDIYPSFQFATTFKLNQDNILRAVYARAARSPAMYPTYLDFKFEADRPTSNTYFHYSGNNELDLTVMDMIEFGYRKNLSNLFLLDVETFYNFVRDFYGTGTMEKSVTQVDDKTFRRTITEQQNLDLKAEQYGVTLALSYTGSKSFWAKIFGTIQYTKLTDHASDIYMEEFGEYTLEDRKHDGTPLFYGGIDINYRPLRKWNLNSNAYFYTSNTYEYKSVNAKGGGRRIPVFETESKFILNTKVSYNISKHASFYLNARNLLNNTSQEFAWTDRIGRTFLFGLNVGY